MSLGQELDAGDLAASTKITEHSQNTNNLFVNFLSYFVVFYFIFSFPFFSGRGGREGGVGSTKVLK